MIRDKGKEIVNCDRRREKYMMEKKEDVELEMRETVVYGWRREAFVIIEKDIPHD